MPKSNQNESYEFLNTDIKSDDKIQTNKDLEKKTEELSPERIQRKRVLQRVATPRDSIAYEKNLR